MKLENQDLKEQLESLREQVRSLQRDRFGKKSERFETEEQGLLFNEVETLAKVDASATPDVGSECADVSAPIEVKAHVKARGHRKPLPESLEREVVTIELPVSEQFAEDGTALKVIGYEYSEKLKYEPAKMSVIQYKRAKYGIDQGEYVKTAPPVPSLLPKSIATPELLSAIVTAKYANGLPLYRMEEILGRDGVEIPRTTMARWMIEVAEACRPILNVLNDRLMTSDYVACDETHVQVLNERGRRPETKSARFHAS